MCALIVSVMTNSVLKLFGIGNILLRESYEFPRTIKQLQGSSDQETCIEMEEISIQTSLFLNVQIMQHH